MSLRRTWRRLLALGRQRHDDQELEHEILAHLELAERDAIAAGSDPADARREALARFGPVGVVRDTHRDVRTLAWLADLRQDGRHAVRSLGRDRVFTTASCAVLTAAVGVGTAVFSIADAVVLRDLPYTDPDRLAAVVEYTPPRPAGSRLSGHTTIQTFLDWRRDQRAFEAVTAVSATRPIAKHPGSEIPATLVGSRVSHEFFKVFRVDPLLGRAFLAEDEADGNHRVALLGHRFWVNAFGAAAGALGQTIELDSEAYRIIGVMPEDFSFRYPVTSVQEADVYVPLRVRAVDRVRGASRNYNYMILGRMPAETDIAPAAEAMAGLSRRLAEEYPDWWRNRRVDVVPLQQHLVGHVAPRMHLLLAAIAGLLLVACVNVANLLLVRSTVRVRDIALRAALGAPRSRLIRIMLIEGLLLSGFSSVCGLVLAHGLLASVVPWLPHDLPRVSEMAVDVRVFVAAMVTGAVTSLIFGLGPAIHASKPEIGRHLRGGAGSVGCRRGERTRAALLVAEVALATVLITGTALFTGSVVNWMRTDLGFHSHNVLTFQAPLMPNVREFADAQAAGAEAVRTLQAQFEIRGNAQAKEIGAALSRLPGTQSVGAVWGGVPLTGGYSRGPFSLPGRSLPAGADPHLDYRRVTANYADVLGIPMREGRYLSADDEVTRGAVTVVNESAARLFWPGESAVGQRLTLFGSTTVTVVGVMGDIRHLGPEVPTVPEVHLPIDSWASAAFVVRTTRSADEVMPSIRAAVASINPDLAVVGEVFALESYASRLVAQRRFTMVLFLGLGAVTLAIAAAGVYGVMAYSVSQRRQEIGVRIALGARPIDVASLVLRRSLLLVTIGLAMGSVGAWYLSSTVETFLFQVSPTDPRTYAIAIATLGLTGIVASVRPAQRAASVDPLVTLKMD